MRFSQTIALITGAGSGIGRAVAIRLADEGAKVILVGRTKAKLEEVALEINSTKVIPMAEIFQADVSDEEDVRELAEYVHVHFRDLHVLINNAGSSRHSSVLDTSTDDWDYMQQVNLRSVFLISKHLGGLMVKRAREEHEMHHRSIVNIASLSGFQADARIPHYSAAKAGVINLTKSLAIELASARIRVNSVSPGFVKTPMTEINFRNDEYRGTIEENTALGRIGTDEEIANVVAFVASDEASYMTGSDLLVDGGWHLK